MPDALIINAHHRLRWHQRLAAAVLTALLWAGWLWLWHPVLQALHWLGALPGGTTPAAPLTLAEIDAISLDQAAFALAATAVTLLLWRLLPTRRVQAPDAETLDEYARYFRLPPEEIRSGRDTQVNVVHHDEQGRIVRIEPRPPA
jgi:poly-beta-1,6-N-acetyl-D-glucosamine biosynthesis protein PgaD